MFAVVGVVRRRAATSSRCVAKRLPLRSLATHATHRPEIIPEQNNTPSFPCVDAHATRQRTLLLNPSQQSSSTSLSGPEPPYARPSPRSYTVYHDPNPLQLTYGLTLRSFDVAYETWGTLNKDKSNAILLHTGLSASSHAAATSANPADGWWQKFIGPGKALDTDKYYVICTNVLGGCYGTTGPSSLDPSTGELYATRFPIISIFDMIRAQFKLLDNLGISHLYASVGCSMGAMQSLAAGWLYSDRVRRIISISGTARSSPSSIAMRFAQRSVLMADPNWNNGFYYDRIPPHTGMKLARQIATITYRSGPEWDQRFGRQVRHSPDASPNAIRVPALCPDFLIETYLDHQGEQFCLKYDANSLIYISKAMDLFDMTRSALESLRMVPANAPVDPPPATSNTSHSHKPLPPAPHKPAPHLSDLAQGLQPISNTPILVLGVQSDILFPVEQQREMADALRMAGNKEVSYYELGGVWGHDTFLLDVQNVGGAIKGFLDSN